MIVFSNVSRTSTFRWLYVVLNAPIWSIIVIVISAPFTAYRPQNPSKYSRHIIGDHEELQYIGAYFIVYAVRI